MERSIIHNSLGPGTVILKGDPLKVVLMEAFQMKSYQIVGPSWLDEDCFDIAAKMPAGATVDKIPAMLQSLLAELIQIRRPQGGPARARCTLWLWTRAVRNLGEASLNFRRTGPRPGEVVFHAAGSHARVQGRHDDGKAGAFSFGWAGSPGARLYRPEGNIRHRPLLDDGSDHRPAAVSDRCVRWCGNGVGRHGYRPSRRSYGNPLYCPPRPAFSGLKLEDCRSYSDPLYCPPGLAGVEAGGTRGAGRNAGDRPRFAGSHRELICPKLYPAEGPTQPC